jgi:hypothetical protein
MASQLLPSSVTVTVPGPAFSHHEYCARVRDEIDVLANLAGEGDLAAKVPWSRTWKLGDLVHHVGAIHRWAANIVEADARRYVPIRDTDDWPTEPDSAEAARWLAQAGTGSSRSSRARTPTAKCGPGASTSACGSDRAV